MRGMVKIIKIAILCLFCNLCFCGAVEIEICHHQFDDDYKSTIKINTDAIMNLNDDAETDNIVKLLQVNHALEQTGVEKVASRKFWESFSTKDNINRKFIIFLQSEIKKDEVREYFKDKNLTGDYCMCKLDLDFIEGASFEIKNLKKIYVDIFFKYDYSVEIENDFFIKEYEKYFDETKLDNKGRTYLEYLRNFDTNIKHEETIVQCLERIGFKAVRYYYSGKIVFEIKPCNKIKGLMKPIILKINNDIKYSVEIIEYKLLGDFINEGVRNKVSIKKIDKTGEKELRLVFVEGNEFLNFITFLQNCKLCNESDVPFRDDVFIEPEMKLILDKVRCEFIPPNNVEVECSKDIEGCFSKKEDVSLVRFKDFFKSKLAFLNKYTNIELNFKVNNDENKEYNLDYKNVTDENIINEIIEDIKETLNPELIINIKKKEDINVPTSTIKKTTHSPIKKNTTSSHMMNKKTINPVINRTVPNPNGGNIDGAKDKGCCKCCRCCKK